MSTFVFADLAGWTALTEAHGDAEPLRIVTDFEARVRSVLPRHHAQEIKTIGDAVMIRVDDPAAAVALGLDLSRGLSASGSPPVCIGMSSGPALERDGDWFGATVNLASRVAGAARPGEVLLTEATRAALPERSTFHLEPRGARRLRHIPDPVSIYRAMDAENGTPTLKIDPVCRMAVDPSRAAAVRRRLGMTRYFCSIACATAFDARPRRYTSASAAARAARNGFLIDLAAFAVVVTAHVLGWLIRGQAHNLLPAALIGVAWAAVLVIHFRMVRRVL